MKEDNIDKLFKNLGNNFDIEIPDSNHAQRFLDKLNQTSSPSSRSVFKIPFWKPLIGIAASIVLLTVLAIGIKQTNNSRELADVSPEMANTQNYFTSTIIEEFVKIQEISTPEVQSIVNDAIKQIEILEDNYNGLKNDLINSDNDSRVIHAMINNFQNRIDILKKTLEEIKNVQQLKHASNETHITI
ncbi:hypothetical protein [Snuella sedimenti]|uniref:DUF4179 domain-containing protein n=1 Tax=Snuella sedimenti TaxID=2798802 RepID=A0A8J7J3E7_9FLAO|nr:hypothetical protein [Snuella sedimenti]MBJ6367658.1 hypothetical protein [Snuella sedimenti]